MQVLNLDLVEEILKRVPVKALGRSTCVSKQWKSIIESKSFQDRHLIYRQQSRDVPYVLFLHSHSNNISSSSSIITIVEFEHMFRCSTSCDCLVCIYKDIHPYDLNIVINPTTRWQRTLPPSKLQQQQKIRKPPPPPLVYNITTPGFGKDKVNGTYKLVWLYNNSREFNLPEVTTTTCEVFDFSTNAWRYVTPSSPYEIADSFSHPPYVDGSLHWFTKCKQAKILSFDLHTETFQVIAKAPFDRAHRGGDGLFMQNMNNRLCISKKWPDQLIIWSLDSDSKTWSLDSYSFPRGLLSPVAFLEEKNKLLLYNGSSCRHLVIYDRQTNSFESVFTSKSGGYTLCFFQSLISI